MKSVEEKISEVLMESAALASERLTEEDVTRHIGSPIERLMLHALWARSVWTGKAEFAAWACGTYSDEVLRHHVRGLINQDSSFMFHFTLVQQMHVGPFRADFGIAAATADDRVLIVAVECDGHEFHERTREQVARDKARDRAFAERDVRLFRFSGSEIWANAIACADQVLGFVSEWQGEPFRRFSEQLRAHDARAMAC